MAAWHRLQSLINELLAAHLQVEVLCCIVLQVLQQLLLAGQDVLQPHHKLVMVTLLHTHRAAGSDAQQQARHVECCKRVAQQHIHQWTDRAALAAKKAAQQYILVFKDRQAGCHATVQVYLIRSELLHQKRHASEQQQLCHCLCAAHLSVGWLLLGVEQHSHVGCVIVPQE
jgi:hypothetical protein